MFCRQCGSQLPDGSAFCNHCGTKIAYLEEAPQPQPNVQPQQPVYAQPQLPPEPTVNGSNEQAAAALKKPASKKWLIVLIVILVLAVIGAGIYFLFFKQTYKLDYGTLDKDGTLTITKEMDRYEPPEDPPVKIRKIVIGKDVETDSISGFASFSDAEEFDVENGNDVYTAVDGALYTKDEESGKPLALVSCPVKKKSIEISPDITEILPNAFYMCNELESVELPAAVAKVGDHPFKFCESMTELTVDPGNNCFMAVDNMLIGKDENGGFTKLLCALRTVTSVTIPETVEIIETSAFYQCEKLTTVNGGTGLKYIGDTAFWSCRSLEHIELPDSVDHIGIQAFFACSSLKEFRVPKQLAELRSVVFEAGDYKDGLTLIVTSTETTINDSNFSTDDNVTIRCYAGSTAESFAKEHDFKIEYLS